MYSYVRSVAVVLEDAYFARSVVRHLAPVVVLALVLALPMGTPSPCGDVTGAFRPDGLVFTRPCKIFQAEVFKRKNLKIKEFTIT